MSKSPFDYLNAINQTKAQLIVDDESEKDYNAFMVNRGLSWFQDTVLYANIMNQYHHLDKKLQNDFFINSIRKRKRFSKWEKPSMNKDMEVVKEYYGYSNEKAKQVYSLLTNEQIESIKKKVDKGGRRK